MTSDYSAVTLAMHKHTPWRCGPWITTFVLPRRITFFNQAVTEIDIHLKVENTNKILLFFFYKWTERTMYNKITFYSPD